MCARITSKCVGEHEIDAKLLKSNRSEQWNVKIRFSNIGADKNILLRNVGTK